jgi:hypothetical protein
MLRKQGNLIKVAYGARVRGGRKGHGKTAACRMRTSFKILLKLADNIKQHSRAFSNSSTL